MLADRMASSSRHHFEVWTTVMFITSNWRLKHNHYDTFLNNRLTFISIHTCILLPTEFCILSKYKVWVTFHRKSAVTSSRNNYIITLVNFCTCTCQDIFLFFVLTFTVCHPETHKSHDRLHGCPYTHGFYKVCLETYMENFSCVYNTPMVFIYFCQVTLSQSLSHCGLILV